MPSSERRRPSAHEDHRGRVVGDRFRLDAPVYTTPTASLYRALDLRSGAAVAVKLIHPEQPEILEARTERAQLEARVLGRLRHPNIVDFIDCNRTPEGLFYVATAFIEGQALDHWCAADRPGLPTRTVWQIGVQVADALICAHAAGVIHRDVKPSNIMWSERQAIAKLADFEIAKLTPDTVVGVSPQRHPTVVGVPIGTYGYIPPEAGDRVDAQTDVFGLGRTLYRLLTRRPAADWPEGLDQVAEPLRSVVMEAGAPDPSWRPATMEELRGRLVAAGLHLFPHQGQGPGMRSARHLWPVPLDEAAAPTPEAGCEGATAGDPCTASSGPTLFERVLELRLQLGAGRGGEVWRAYHHALECDVVVKRVAPALSEYAAKLRREAAALQKLTHPAFPRVYTCDMAEADGSWYMVQEYIVGETFAALLRHGRPDVLVAVELVATVAEALAEAHARGVVHGDVHPGNFMIEPSTPPRARVIDLNECRLLAHYFAATPQRYAAPPPLRDDAPRSRVMGRPAFAAPELTGGGRPTVRSDLYGLGCVLFALITGAEAPAAVLDLLLRDGPRERLGDRLVEYILEHAPDLDSSELMEVIYDVLAPEPEHRRITMASFADALRSTAHSIREIRSPTPTSPTSSATSPTSPTSAPPLSPTTSPAPATATAPPVPATTSPTTATAAVPPVPATTSPTSPWPAALGFVLVATAIGSALFAVWPSDTRAPAAITPTADNTPSLSLADDAPAQAPTGAPAPADTPTVSPADAISAPPPDTTAMPPSTASPARPPRARPVAPARSSARQRERTEPVTKAEATAAARGALQRLRACQAPDVIVADLEIQRGRAAAVAVNFKPAAQVKPGTWESCVRRELEAVQYPDTTDASRLRVRLPLKGSEGPGGAAGPLGE